LHRLFPFSASAPLTTSTMKPLAQTPLSWSLLACLGVLAVLTLPDVLTAAAAELTPLFDGRTLNGWRAPTGDWKAVGEISLDLADPAKFRAASGTGVLLNGDTGRTVNLITEGEWGEVELHVEFCVPKGSNSGVYLMGRYEVQVYDSFGVARDKYPGIECGGIYPRWTQARGEFEGHSPRVNASGPPGEWQSFDIVFHAPRFDPSGRKAANARFVSVKHNGQLIHENIELTGPTRAAVWEDEKDEKPKGPLMLQGDHGPVAYRNLQLRPLEAQR
jgi:hypothetical protein